MDGCIRRSVMQPFCRPARYTRWKVATKGKERAVFSCGYNGWVDVPEEEREGLDAFEASCAQPRAVPALLPPTVRLLLPSSIPVRKAA
jgi:hypothetical protein